MKESSRRTIILRWVLGTLVVLWCWLIFSMSGETAVVSSGRSTGLVRRFIGAFVTLFGGDASDLELMDLLEYYIRKAAHMFLYYVLSVLVFSFLSCYSLRIKVRSILTLAFCFLYCISDEFHQLFVEGRSGNLFDVCIDMIGAALALVCIMLIIFIYKKVKRKNHHIAPTVI